MTTQHSLQQPFGMGGFASLAVLVVLAAVAGLTAALAQRMALEGDTIASERIQLHRQQAAQTAYLAALTRIQKSQDLPRNRAELTALRSSQLIASKPLACLPQVVPGFCLGLSITDLADNWPQQWWAFAPYRAMMLANAARINVATSPHLPADHPLRTTYYWLRPFEQVGSEQIAWQIMVLVAATDRFGQDQAWTLWSDSPTP